MRFLEDLAPELDLIQTQPLFMSTTSKPKRMVFIGAEWILNDPKLEIISSIWLLLVIIFDFYDL